MSLHTIGPLRPHAPNAGAPRRGSAETGKSVLHRKVIVASASARLGLGVGGLALAIRILTASRLDLDFPNGVEALAVLAAGTIVAGAASVLRPRGRRG